MNIRKRTLAMLLVLCMLISGVPMTTMAANVSDTNPVVTKETDVTAETVEATEETAEETAETAEETAEETKETAEETEETAEETEETAEETEEAAEETEETAEETEEAAEETEEAAEETKETAEETVEAAKETEKSAGVAVAAIAEFDDPYAVAITDVAKASQTHTFEHRILHLDNGRKYYTKDWIKALLNEMSAAGYTHDGIAVFFVTPPLIPLQEKWDFSCI